MNSQFLKKDGEILKINSQSKYKDDYNYANNCHQFLEFSGYSSQSLNVNEWIKYIKNK